ncbi:Enoyl-CoA hydratase / Delta(3)-cis-delta(2)-trans-enoyl-CoA isomerase / 3-hydroxyacyl-CoA dehydrogenase / 3-hydroxybutyryl-CoA epimerase [hydrothermal vent metagenome]|uniref:enoyl-CoA hydratase n=1 Tax=hydrothermal vent metagenome TaxID=652676 RepID=A0A3B1DKM2_9ZZZZ
MAITLKIEGTVGFIEFDQEESKVNLLTAEVIMQLNRVLDELKTHKNLSVLIIISKKKDVFIAGADIKEIEKITESADGERKAKAGQDVLNKLEDLCVPTIAVIDGVALGGGCELALACDYRLATFNDKVRIGLPEVNLGFVPGFGGTYRLPRLIGLTEGLKMILSGKPINTTKALRIGLVDCIVTQKNLDTHIQVFIQDIQNKKIKNKKPRKIKKGLPGFLESSLSGQWLIFNQSRKNVLKLSKGFYPAPLKAITVIKKTFFKNRTEGLSVERKAFGQLAITGISKNLVQLFYLSEQYKKLSLPETNAIKPQKINKCGVLGAGIMGGGIAQLLSSRDVWIRLKDINYDAISLGLKSAAAIYKKAVKTRRLTQPMAAAKMAKITGTLDYSGFQNADIVIEAVIENMEIKKNVFKELSAVTSKNTILATNTSALSVTEMAQQTQDPSKVIGFHFFNPVHRMSLVEIITTPLTSKETIVTTLNFVKRLGKKPILVKDSCGFLVNRILLGYINEAGRLLEEGANIKKIDHVATQFGMPMGPFLLCDEVGLDVGIKVLHILENGLGKRFKAVNIFEEVYKTGNLGKKTGKGYYIHRKGQKSVPNPQIAKLVKKIDSKKPSSKECLERLIYIMINEAAKCLDEGIIDEPGAVDIGMILGIGFPAFRGGLLRYADSIGIDNLITQLEQFSKKLKAERFKPAKYLLALSAKGGSASGGKKNKKAFFNEKP